MKKVSVLSMKDVEIPKDGTYKGSISGYEVTFVDTYSIEYAFHVDEGVRGIFIPVEVTILNGEFFIKVL